MGETTAHSSAHPTTVRDTARTSITTSTQATTTTTTATTQPMALAHTTTKDFLNLIPDNGTAWILPTDIWQSISDTFIIDESHTEAGTVVSTPADSFTTFGVITSYCRCCHQRGW